MVDEKGNQIGVLSKSAALAKAQEAGLDLVEVAPKAQPPVAKIIDFKKFKYQQAKKLRESAKKSKVEIKEIHLTPFIAAGDLQTRLERIEEFLGDGDRVKLVVKFAGRQITRKEFGYELLEKVLKMVERGAPDGEPKLQGRQLYLILNPSKAKKDETEDEKITSKKN